MVKRLWRLAVQYWQCSVAIVSALVGLGLQLWGYVMVAHWVLGIVSLALTVPLVVQIWHNIRSGQYGNNILTPTAVVAAVLLHQYWAAILIAFLSAGEAIFYGYAEARSRSELDELRARGQASSLAHVFRGRKTVDIAPDQIQPNDKLLVKTHDIVPVDGVILDGNGRFSDLLLAGRDSLQTKSVGDEILSGSTITSGTVTIKALRSAPDSHYGRVMRLVRTAGIHQTPFVRQANRFSLPFTAAAYAIAIAVWVVSGDAIRFLEVIVVATPAPLLLAAPIAFIAGLSRASKHGILIKNGSTLERLAGTDTIAFDKIGTITRGEPTVDTITAFKPYTKSEILALAASVGQGSVHSLARTISQEANKKHLKYSKAKHVQAIAAGFGLTATLRGKTVVIGSAAALEHQLVAIPKNSVPARNQYQRSTVYVVVDGTVAGTIGFSDELRTGAKSSLEHLKLLGIRKTLLFTDDTEAAAKLLAKLLGITDYRAQALPIDKLHAIDQVPRANRPVVFVGSGVGDASALTAADVGIVLGMASPVGALESADVVIVPDNFDYVVRTLTTAQRVLRIARQSILLGISLSFVLMLVFASGRLPAWLGVILQEIIVVGTLYNALRAHRNPKQYAL